jgi:hypothetical protein
MFYFRCVVIRGDRLLNHERWAGSASAFWLTSRVTQTLDRDFFLARSSRPSESTSRRRGSLTQRPLRLQQCLFGH